VVIESHIDPSDATFKANRQRMEQLVADLRERVEAEVGRGRRAA
jgi:hypothetical protein